VADQVALLGSTSQNCFAIQQSLTFRKKPWSKLAPKISDSLASTYKYMYFSEKREKLVGSEKVWSHWQPQRLQHQALYNNDKQEFQA